jgi:diguanylate cyclase (GGDEF)-like protein
MLLAAVGAGRGAFVLRVRQLKARELRLRDVVTDRTAQLNRANDSLRQRTEELERANLRLGEVNADLAEANARLHDLTVHDPLTGIANRRFLEEALDREWRRAGRTRAAIAVAMIDIDWFKTYNDTFGHQRGDECLRRIAGCLAGGLRRAADVVARYGGEEFVAVLPDTDGESAARIGEMLRARVEAEAIPGAGPSGPRTVTVSVGVAAEVASEASSPWALLAAADRALYRAKVAGRNRVVSA